MAFIAANITSRDIAAMIRSPLPAILLSAGRFAMPRYEHAPIAVAGIRHHVNGEVWHNQQTRPRQRRLVACRAASPMAPPGASMGPSNYTIRIPCKESRDCGLDRPRHASRRHRISRK
jgi:hypothetical protein